MSVGTDLFACVFAFGCSKAMLIDGGGAGGRSIYLDDRMLRSITKSAGVQSILETITTCLKKIDILENRTD